MRLKHIFAGIAASLAIQTAAANAACDEGEIRVRFSHVVAADGHPKGEAAAYLAERVNAELDGELCMEVYPDSSLYEDDEALKALLAGELELAAPSSARFDQYTGRLRLFDLPFLFKDSTELGRFSSGEMGRKLLASVEGHGLVGLDYWLAGFKQFTADRPLLMPADARGLSFRVQESELSAAMIQALEATAKPIPLAKVRDALASGEVNGQENTWSNIATQGFHGVQDGVTETNHQSFVYVLVTSSQFLAGLSPAVRERFLDIVADATSKANADFAGLEAENRRQIEASGETIRTLTEAQRRQWVEAMRPVWDKFADGIGKDAIEAALRTGS